MGKGKKYRGLLGWRPKTPYLCTPQASKAVFWGFGMRKVKTYRWVSGWCPKHPYLCIPLASPLDAPGSCGYRGSRGDTVTGDIFCGELALLEPLQGGGKGWGTWEARGTPVASNWGGRLEHGPVCGCGECSAERGRRQRFQRRGYSPIGYVS